MGYARYSSDEFTTYTKSTNLRSMTREQVFSSRHLNQALDPSKIILRESCDSEQNPNSTPIILGLDVTGSMGFVAEAIAKNGLEQLMTAIYDSTPVPDPHLMFMGIGDIQTDEAPLQVSQFEAGAVAIIEQLRSLYLEGHGGGNDTESYDLPWYFAANRTSIDCYNKRGKKGFIFTIGDEMAPYSALPMTGLKRVFGKGTQLPEPGQPEDLLATVNEKYTVFHIIAEEGSFARAQLQRVRASWKKLLGPNVIYMKDHNDLPAIVLAALRIANGEDAMSVVNESQIRDTLMYAFPALQTQG